MRNLKFKIQRYLVIAYLAIWLGVMHLWDLLTGRAFIRFLKRYVAAVGAAGVTAFLGTQLVWSILLATASSFLGIKFISVAAISWTFGVLIALTVVTAIAVYRWAKRGGSIEVKARRGGDAVHN